MKKVIEAAGWIYFILSLIGSIILVVKSFSKDILGETEINTTLIAIGISALIQGVIILLVCLALSDLLNQNEKILTAVKKD